LGHSWRRRLAKLLQQAESCALSLLVDRVEVVERTPADSTRGGGQPRLDLDLLLHVDRSHTS
jgi:hypothetical protein